MCFLTTWAEAPADAERGRHVYHARGHYSFAVPTGDATPSQPRRISAAKPAFHAFSAEPQAVRRPSPTSAASASAPTASCAPRTQFSVNWKSGASTLLCSTTTRALPRTETRTSPPRELRRSQACRTGTGGSGGLISSTLEMSNVDLSQEFADMITTQRGFQANSRLITVSDTLLEELINLKR